MFYDVDRTPINVTKKDFVVYVEGLKKGAYTTLSSDNFKARYYFFPLFAILGTLCNVPRSLLPSTKKESTYISYFPLLVSPTNIKI